MNAIGIIAPYKYEGMWVFDDSAVGLTREPFIAGIDEMIDQLVASIPDGCPCPPSVASCSVSVKVGRISSGPLALIGCRLMAPASQEGSQGFGCASFCAGPRHGRSFSGLKGNKVYTDLL